MLNRQQKGALCLIVSVLGSLYYVMTERLVEDSYTGSSLVVVEQSLTPKTLIILFWLAYGAILGTYLLLTDDKTPS